MSPDTHTFETNTDNTLTTLLEEVPAWSDTLPEDSTWTYDDTPTDLDSEY